MHRETGRLIGRSPRLLVFLLRARNTAVEQAPISGGRRAVVAAVNVLKNGRAERAKTAVASKGDAQEHQKSRAALPLGACQCAPRGWTVDGVRGSAPALQPGRGGQRHRGPDAAAGVWSRGPGTPPDRDAPETNSDAPDTNSDAPETYSTNAEGNVCLCSPYQIGCSATPAAPKSCEKACQAGYARYDLYCQNGAPDALRSKCGNAAKLGLSTCLDTPRDRGCDSPCVNLQLMFQPFCRDHARNDACWSASNKGYGECKAKG